MDKKKIKKLHRTIMSLFFHTMCVACLMCSWGFFFAYIMGGISLKLFLGYGIICAVLVYVVYAMIDPMMHKNHEGEE